MDLKFECKAFVIVGGSRGMGRAAAEVIARGGGNLAIITRGRAGAEAAAQALAETHGVRAAGFGLEGEDRNAAAVAAIASAIEVFGAIDGIGVAAGPMGRRPGVEGIEARREEFHLLEDADWDQHYENQVMTAVRPLRAILPHFIARGRGNIVTTSAYSIRAQKPKLSHYTAMKSAVASLTKNISTTYAERGIRANCICPGMIETEGMTMSREQAVATFGGEGDEALAAYARQQGMKIAMGRVGQASEVGELMAFLLSEYAAYVTGAMVNIDGGTDF